MASFKVLILFTLVIGYVSCQQARIDQDYGEIARYQFAYSIDDPETGDKHAQEEQRDGDVVNGYYIVLQPDGLERRVEYTSDEEHGFQAKVTYQAGQARAAAPVVKPVQPVQVAVPVPVQVVRPAQPAVLRTVVKKRPVAQVRTVQAPVQTYTTPIQTVQTYSAPIQTVQSYSAQPIAYSAQPYQTYQTVPVSYSSGSPAVQILQTVPSDSSFGYTLPQSQVYTVGQTILRKRK